MRSGDVNGAQRSVSLRQGSVTFRLISIAGLQPGPVETAIARFRKQVLAVQWGGGQRGLSRRRSPTPLHRSTESREIDNRIGDAAGPEHDFVGWVSVEEPDTMLRSGETGGPSAHDPLSVKIVRLTGALMQLRVEPRKLC